MDRQEIRRRLAPLGNNNGINIVKVIGVRDAIKSGSYDDDEKMDIAIDRLLEDLRRRMDQEKAA